MKPIKQIVYLPVKVEDELPKGSGFYKTEEVGTAFFQRGDQTWWDNDVDGTKRYPKNWLKKEEAYFFTPEQLNEYTTNVIKQALETAVKKAEITNKAKFSGDYNPVVDEESIKNTFEETFKKFEV